jgi:hypothetical protein
MMQSFSTSYFVVLLVVVVVVPVASLTSFLFCFGFFFIILSIAFLAKLESVTGIRRVYIALFFASLATLLVFRGVGVGVLW